jgi:hypothetical protein
MMNMIFKSETKIFSCVTGGNGLEGMTAKINEYIKDKENIEILYHNITTNDEGYVIATVKAAVERSHNSIKKKAKNEIKSGK